MAVPLLHGGERPTSRGPFTSLQQFAIVHDLYHSAESSVYLAKVVKNFGPSSSSSSTTGAGGGPPGGERAPAAGSLVVLKKRPISFNSVVVGEEEVVGGGRRSHSQPAVLGARNNAAKGRGQKKPGLLENFDLLHE